MFGGLPGFLLEGMFRTRRKRENFDDAGAIERDLFLAELVLFIAILGAAILVAGRCGGGFRQYAGAVLEPYVYLIVRLVVPCAGAAR